MSTEQTSAGSGDAPGRSIIGFVPELRVDGDAAGDTASKTDESSRIDESSVPTRTDAVTDSADSDATTDAADSATDVDSDIDDDAVYYEDQVEPEYGILGFTLRELVIVGAWALMFIVSFFPVLGGGASVWISGIDWLLAVGVPTAAVFLVVLRRFSPEGIRRVGSLGIDQFASVAATVAAVAWTQVLWHQVSASVALGAFLVGWVPIAALIAALALVAATVFAPIIPRLREDFEGRMETLAHRNADPVRPVIRRPRPNPAPPAAAVEGEPDTLDPMADPDADSDGPDPQEGAAVAEDEPWAETDADATRVIEVSPLFDAPDSESRQEGTSYTDPIGALHEIFETNGTVVPAEAEDEDYAPGDTTHSRGEAEALLRRNRSEHPRPTDPDAQPFWILAGTERDVLDERGQPLYRIGPSAWTLVIEDRDGAYVVRHDDGRIGYLHDLTDITKG